mgnify:CR=1 FL=1
MATPANRDVIRPARGKLEYFEANLDIFKEGEVLVDYLTNPAKPKAYIKYNNNLETLF